MRKIRKPNKPEMRKKEHVVCRRTKTYGIEDNHGKM